jgi:hypothetical protein
MEAGAPEALPQTEQTRGGRWQKNEGAISRLRVTGAIGATCLEQAAPMSFHPQLKPCRSGVRLVGIPEDGMGKIILGFLLEKIWRWLSRIF